MPCSSDKTPKEMLPEILEVIADVTFELKHNMNSVSNECKSKFISSGLKFNSFSF